MKSFLLFTYCFFVVGFVFSQNTYSSASSTSVQYTKYRFGGYGEILFQQMDFSPDRYNNPEGSPAENRTLFDIPRAVLSFDYKFNDDLVLSTEIEFEHGGTGSALELEYEEMGEYEMEMEKAGEVVLEQLHLTKRFSNAFSIRMGHMIVPVGRTNNYHIPTEYFTSVRPEGENTILPLAWHETGISILGRVQAWYYELQLVNGLDANGFSSAYWIREGRQTIFETTKATNPAVAFRLENRSILNLRMAASFYRGNSAANTAKPEKMEDIKGTVTIGAFDFEYNAPNFIARGNLVYGDLTDAYDITRINKNISKNIQYSRTPVANNALCYSAEAGYNVMSLFKPDAEKLFVFGRYEYYNSMENTDVNILSDARFRRTVLTAGINYYLHPTVALKLDYSARIIDGGNFNRENTIGLSLVYSGWFASK